MKLHHIGIACEDIDRTCTLINNIIGIKHKGNIVYDKEQDAYLCMILTMYEDRIELISGNKVSNLVKRQQYLYHTCFLVDDLSKTIEQMTQNGAFILLSPKPAILFDNRKVAFLVTDLGIVELLEGDIINDQKS